MSIQEFWIGNRNEIPEDYKDKLSKLMRLNRIELSNLPSPNIVYYREQLEKPVDNDVGLLYGVVVGNSREILGYSIFEYRLNEINDIKYGTLNIFIEKEKRNHGIGTILLQKMLKNLPEQIITIRIDSKQKSPGDNFIAKNKCFEKKFEVELNVSDLKQFNKKEIAKETNLLLEKLKTNGYRIFYVNNDSFTPIESKYSRLMEFAWNTPIDVELSNKEHEEFPVERVRGMFEHIKNMGATMHVFLVEHIKSKDLVGLTQFVISDSNPHVVDQSFTAVIPKHRSKGIGYTMKLNTLNYLLQSTSAQYWMTANAKLNSNMIKINEKLGYKEWARYNVYEVQREKWTKFIK